MGRSDTIRGALPGARVAPADDELLGTRLVRARFEALAEWGVALADARAIAQEVSVDIIEVVALLRQGCPADLVLAILG
jgi:hypothetical protein